MKLFALLFFEKVARVSFLRLAPTHTSMAGAARADTARVRSPDILNKTKARDTPAFSFSLYGVVTIYLI